MTKLPELYSQYDFIVLGEHPAALWGAHFLLKQGLKVLILPLSELKHRNFAPKFVLDAFEIESGGFLDTPNQILTGQKRFRVFPALDSLSEEFLFVYGKELTPGVVFDSEIQRGLTYLHRGSESGPILPEDWQSLVSKNNEMVYFNEPEGWLQNQMLTKLLEAGAHVLRAKHVHRVFVEKNTFVGVQAEGSSTIIQAQQVLLGVNWNVITQYLSEPTSLFSQPTGWVFDLVVEIPEDALPIGLSAYMIYVEKNSPVVEIHHNRKGQFKIQTVLPFTDGSLSHREQRKIAQRLFRVISGIIPDLEYNLQRVVPDLRDPESAEQVELPKLYPYQKLSEIPSHRLRYGAPGLGHRSPFVGVTIAYEEAYPRFGEWGAYQAVQLGIQEWAKPLQKNDVMKISVGSLPTVDVR